MEFGPSLIIVLTLPFLLPCRGVRGSSTFETRKKGKNKTIYNRTMSMTQDDPKPNCSGLLKASSAQPSDLCPASFHSGSNLQGDVGNPRV